jgi:polysaccharide deacetylase 2 family uncharacterized protein YibQ
MALYRRMFRLKVIRRSRKSPGLLHGADAVFAGLLLLALGVGGSAALSGFPEFLRAVIPDGAARAGEYASLPLPPGGTPSHFTPQTLFPVTAHPLPHWLVVSAPAAPVAAAKGPPRIAIVIDDLGEDLAGTDKAMKLPAAVTLSFLPFADGTPWMAQEAERGGHEVIAHVPMQALGPINPGPMALRVGLSPQDIGARLNWSLARVPGLVGINNHEGSRFTADATGLAPVAQVLAARHLFFFDSRTTADSKVMMVAHRFGVPSAGRDVFLDDVVAAPAIAAQLAELEKIARRQGVAIAIGHPHDATLTALASWKHPGIELVPLSEAIRLKSGQAVAVAAR